MNSIWLENKENNNFEKLENNQHTKVCIIGGGIFGITTAYYLTQKGYDVILLEREEIASKVSAHTTAKITSRTWTNISLFRKTIWARICKKIYSSK